MNDTRKILVVEDDDALRDALLITLGAAKYRAVGVPDGNAALDLLAKDSFGMVVSDLRMEPMDGLQLLARIRALHPGMPVLLMTAFGDVDKAVAAMRGGACDFMLKPFEPRALIEQIERYAQAPTQAAGVISEDAATRDSLLLAARVAKTDATVFLAGESGVGKEIFARYIHDQSPRVDGPFVAINCAAIPDTLLEATLFGYEKGAFTGAQTAQAGKFEQANGGTLLLDEVSEMPLLLQAKLLRVLQERVVDRVGGKSPIPLDIRIVATSNCDMQAEVEKGRFREDLFYRLHVFPIQIPPLRERPADILPLARHFVELLGAKLPRQPEILPAAAAKLAAHAWPGNVRELENVVQRALILAADTDIDAGHIAFNAPSAPHLEVLATAERPPQPPEAPGAEKISDLERQHILETLAAVGGSRKEAIARLGISERTLRYKLKQYRDGGFLDE